MSDSAYVVEAIPNKPKVSSHAPDRPASALQHEGRKIKRMRRFFDSFLLVPAFMAYLAYPLFLGEEGNEAGNSSSAPPTQ